MSNPKITAFVITTIFIVGASFISSSAENPTGAATGTAAVEIATPPPATGAETFDLIPSLPRSGAQPRDVKGAVVKVQDGKIYVDLGALNGIIENTVMDVYRMEPIVNLKGEVLDEEEVAVGKIKILEVRPRLSIGEATEKKVEFERGFLVKGLAAPRNDAGTAYSGRCPADMLYDGGGPFSFTPGSMFSSETAEQQTLETSPFCIDQYPADRQATWSSARSFCENMGKRLCRKSELQKVCAEWEKPAVCLPELEKEGRCPEQSTIMDFKSSLEWSTETVADNGKLTEDANSCSCPRTSPVCAHCYFPECRGAEKQFRCCADSFQE